ncbi:MAG: multiprotein bridging factor aMBF1 [Nitrososphaeria archaeon]
MNCEICGKRVDGKPNKIMVDGSILEVCNSCANLGEEVKEIPRNKLKPRPRMMTHTQKIDLEEMEIVPDYALTIKRAREKMGLSQDDLARRVNEKASVISLIESSKMKPSIFIGQKLERALKIDLFAMIEEK